MLRRLATALRAGALTAALLPGLGLAGEPPDTEVLPRPEAVQAPGCPACSRCRLPWPGCGQGAAGGAGTA
ncbi:hypothetical protein ACFQU2_23895 [Siccirubricoccus deserti]